jgi:branched-chain amino acid transport system ATP-binding protein
MAISGQPKVMLLDEPTSGVAAEEKFPLMDLVMEVLKTAGVTILFVEHDMDIVTRYSERVLAFYDGRIVANDAPDEVLADEVVQRYVTGTAR